MTAPTSLALNFAAALDDKFADMKIKYTVEAGRVYDKIVMQDWRYVRPGQTPQSSVHAFVHRKNGTVHKAATWRAPEVQVRYETVDDAVEASDWVGSYLYKGSSERFYRERFARQRGES